jgi:hypothetical protein
MEWNGIKSTQEEDENGLRMETEILVAEVASWRTIHFFGLLEEESNEFRAKVR